MVKYTPIETLLYKTEYGDNISIKVVIDQKNETMWATQKTIAEIFNVTKQNISYHIIDIFDSGELNQNSTVKKILTVQDEGKRKVKRKQSFYNLDVIISVGYRVNSKEATQFRKWSTSILKDYMIKGFALDIDLLKNGTRFGKDYFDELLETIREIRASERRFNQKITDIYATSYDYDKYAQISKEFFASAQNKLIYAVSGHTAAELIDMRSDENKTHMGLTNWKNSPNGKILASDIVISKNYLNQEELTRLNRLVDGFLTLAETRAIDHELMAMKDWKELLDDYITLNRLPVLVGKGTISSEEAKNHVKEKFKKFRVTQDENFISDFDQLINDIKRLEGMK